MLPTNDQTRIVGGQPAHINDFPWIVSLQSYGNHRCAACIVTENRALTAAHCTIFGTPSILNLRAGSSDYRSGGQLLQTSRFVTHPDYNTYSLEYDISIVHTMGSWSMVGTPGIAVIPMPQQDAPAVAGTMTNVAGWGAVCEDCAGSTQLRSVAVPIVSNADCNRYYSGGVTDGMLCAGFPEGGRDACQGDSGGPLSANGLLIGLVSWGDGCARPRSPGVYVRVAFFRSWIDSQLRT